MWGKDLQFQRDIPIHKDYAVLALVANLQNHVYCSGRDGSLRYFRVPWRNNNNDILLHAVAADVTGDENIAVYHPKFAQFVHSFIYSIVLRW